GRWRARQDRGRRGRTASWQRAQRRRPRGECGLRGCGPSLPGLYADLREPHPARARARLERRRLGRRSRRGSPAARLTARSLGTALDDRLHQPYRVRLFPWLPAVADAARKAGALGCVLSGAGPALLAVVAGAEGETVARAMEEALSRAGVRGAARALAVDREGAVAAMLSDSA